MIVAKVRQPDPSPADSLKELDRLAVELVGKRDADGRFVPRYPGINKPKLDADFDKKDWVVALMEASEEGKRRPVCEGSARAFEQLCWWGLRRKKLGVEVFGVGGAHGIPIQTPDGSWVLAFIGWRKIK